MTEARKGTEKKIRKKPADQALMSAPGADDAGARPGRSVGDVLRLAREKKDKTIEGVSAVINIRAAQLRALEAGNLAALPGMTYAVGFLRSYANYLDLDADELVRRFKAEHTEVAEKPDLHFPAPVSQSHLPGPAVMAAAGAGAVVLLIAWAFVASSGDSEEKAVLADVPALTEAAPAVADALPESQIPAVEAEADVPAVVADVAAGVGAALSASTMETVTTDGALAEASVAAISVPPVPVIPAVPAVPAVPDIPAAAVVPAAEPVAAEVEAVAPVSPAAAPRVQPRPKDLLAGAREFGERRSGSRVTITALKPSWIQVVDKQENVIFKKVLQPGEKYNVPQMPGLLLTTSNAGGLRFSVDGLAVQAVGNEGEIVRGVSLNPAELSRFRVRTRR